MLNNVWRAMKNIFHKIKQSINIYDKMFGTGITIEDIFLRTATYARLLQSNLPIHLYSRRTVDNAQTYTTNNKEWTSINSMFIYIVSH